MNEKTRTKVIENININCDNQGAIALAKDPIRKERLKHIDIKYHFINSEIQRGTISLNYVPTNDNNADVFMKPIIRNKLQMLTTLLGQ